ncbi:MAG: hypothetical protein JWM44_564 [Bacilli bacterium]|nr:hypothetical protein [Bacilli bacterium]
MFNQTYDDVSEFVYKHKLTRLQGGIFCLIALNGYSNQQIATHCMISEKTVKNHIVNIMNKIGARSVRKLLSLMILEMMPLGISGKLNGAVEPLSPFIRANEMIISASANLIRIMYFQLFGIDLIWIFR